MGGVDIGRRRAATPPWPGLVPVRAGLVIDFCTSPVRTGNSTYRIEPTETQLFTQLSNYSHLHDATVHIGPKPQMHVCIVVNTTVENGTGDWPVDQHKLTHHLSHCLVALCYYSINHQLELVGDVAVPMSARQAVLF